jgi:mycobactin salicyl-AMP ligase
MIVESQAGPIAAEGQRAAVYRSLDELLRFWAQKRPDAVALSGSGVADYRLRSFTFAAADAAVSRLSARLLAEGLTPGDIVAIQLPNTVELALVALAAMRAGLVASPAPLVWRKTELLRAFDRAPVKAAITCSRFRAADYARVMRRAAAAQAEKTGDAPAMLFGFGDELPDGVISLSRTLDSDAAEPVFPVGAAPEPPGAERPGLLSWGFDREFGPVAIPRVRQEIVAAGLAPALELQLGVNDRIISPYSIASLVGLAGAVAPWLITGASLLLHIPYDHETFMQQIRTEGVTVAVAPAPVLADLAGREGFAAGGGSLSRVLWVLPAPHSPAPAVQPFPGITTVMLRSLREYALATSLWSEGPDAGAIPLGAAAVAAPGSGGAPLLETRIRSRVLRGLDCLPAHEGRSASGRGPVLSGELCVRGLSAPRKQDHPAAKRLKCDAEGFVCTGIPCVAGGDAQNAIVCLPEPDVAYHGGAVIDIQELDRIYSDFPDFLDAAAFTIADPIMGERIFAAVVPLPGAAPPEAEFRSYLQGLEISPVKFPEKLIVVSVIPRDAQGRAVRAEILSQI